MWATKIIPPLQSVPSYTFNTNVCYSNRNWTHISQSELWTKFQCKKLFEIESNIIYHDTKDVQVISKKPYKCCVYLRGQYGLLTFPPRAKKPRCITCKNSKTCRHCELWERAEGSHKTDVETVPRTGSRKQINANSYKTVPGRLKVPLSEEKQNQFRQYASEGYTYKDLTNLVPPHSKEEKCSCGHKFDDRDPVLNNWVLSRKVR